MYQTTPVEPPVAPQELSGTYANENNRYKNNADLRSPVTDFVQGAFQGVRELGQEAQEIGAGAIDMVTGGSMSVEQNQQHEDQRAQFREKFPEPGFTAANVGKFVGNAGPLMALPVAKTGHAILKNVGIGAGTGVLAPSSNNEERIQNALIGGTGAGVLSGGAAAANRLAGKGARRKAGQVADDISNITGGKITDDLPKANEDFGTYLSRSTQAQEKASRVSYQNMYDAALSSVQGQSGRADNIKNVLDDFLDVSGEAGKVNTVRNLVKRQFPEFVKGETADLTADQMHSIRKIASKQWARADDYERTLLMDLVNAVDDDMGSAFPSITGPLSKARAAASLHFKDFGSKNPLLDKLVHANAKTGDTLAPEKVVDDILKLDSKATSKMMEVLTRRGMTNAAGSVRKAVGTRILGDLVTDAGVVAKTKAETALAVKNSIKTLEDLGPAKTRAIFGPDGTKDLVRILKDYKATKDLPRWRTRVGEWMENLPFIGGLGRKVAGHGGSSTIKNSSYKAPVAAPKLGRSTPFANQAFQDEQ